MEGVSVGSHFLTLSFPLFVPEGDALIALTDAIVASANHVDYLRRLDAKREAERLSFELVVAPASSVPMA
jgi:hypothetical protein